MANITKNDNNYKLIVIGCGTSGLRTALECAKKGNKTLVIEEGKMLGGTCLNTGCIPTKTMLHSSHLFKSSQNFKKFGVNVGKIKLDFKTMMKRVHWFINDGQKHILKSVANCKNLTLIRGKASFVDDKTVIVNMKKFTADNFIISTGAKNTLLSIKGLDSVDYLDNESVINLKKVPKSIAMIGGGYISMEFATFFNDIGCKVTVLEKMPSILGMLDDDVSGLLTDIYEKAGIEINTGTDILRIRKKGKNVAIEISKNGKKKTLNTEKVLLAVGRTPNTHGMNLEKAGIAIGARKNIEVNDFLQTSKPNIYAIGDVNGRAMFAHSAKRESKIILSNILENKNNPKRMNFNIMPWAVFTHPTIAGVGISERTANEKGIKHSVMKSYFSRTGKASIIDETEGFVKIIYNPETKEILGSTIIGPDADNLIHEIVSLMNSKSGIDVLKESIHVHPTLAEVMENLNDI